MLFQRQPFGKRTGPVLISIFSVLRGRQRCLAQPGSNSGKAVMVLRAPVPPSIDYMGEYQVCRHPKANGAFFIFLYASHWPSGPMSALSPLGWPMGVL